MKKRGRRKNLDGIVSPDLVTSCLPAPRDSLSSPRPASYVGRPEAEGRLCNADLGVVQVWCRDTGAVSGQAGVGVPPRWCLCSRSWRGEKLIEREARVGWIGWTGKQANSYRERTRTCECSVVLLAGGNRQAQTGE